MAPQTNKAGTLLVIKKSVLEELILSTARLQTAIASVIEGSIIDMPVTGQAVLMKRAEEEELSGVRESEEPAISDEEQKAKDHAATKASEGRARTAKAKRAKEAEAKKASKKEAEPVEVKAEPLEEVKDAPKATAEELVMSEEEVMAQLKTVGMQLFKADKEAFQSIQKDFEVKAFPMLDYDGKLRAIKAMEHALAKVSK